MISNYPGTTSVVGARPSTQAGWSTRPRARRAQDGSERPGTRVPEGSTRLVTPLATRFPLRDMEHPVFDSHLARTARDRYRFADRLFSLTGNVVIVDLAASRDL